MGEDIFLKKKLIGGFDRKQVIEYINNLQSECSNQHTKDELIELRSLIADLTCELEERNAKVQSLKETVIKLNSGLTEDEHISYSFRHSLKEIDAAKSMAKSVSDTLEQCAVNSDEDIAPLLERLNEINNEFDKISNICKNSSLSESIQQHENEENPNCDDNIEKVDDDANSNADIKEKNEEVQKENTAESNINNSADTIKKESEPIKKGEDSPTDKDKDNPENVYFTLDY